MEHLTLEQLARLVEEAPTAEEGSHLQGCAECRDALTGLVEQTAAVGALEDPMPPAGLDQRVRAALLREGLIDTPSGQRADTGLAEGELVGPTPARVTPAAGPWPPIGSRARRIGGGLGVGQLAAGIALFILGAAVGTVATRSGGRPVETAAVEVPTSDEVAAATALRSAEAAYLDAIEAYSEATGTVSTGDPLSRLAALEGIVLTTRAALEDAPADPIINNYHLTALGQRNALMRQIESAANGDEWF